ncbi:MAG TPA: MATE family efflux transporter [Steroidobacteraceae bacterium]|nr:MATE family efflux transporter [Steroidobacteraceae bacterium]
MQDLTQGSIVKHLMQMAAFIAAGMLFQTLYIIVDLYFVSALGKEALAGVGAAANVMFIVMAVMQVLTIGGVTLISHAVGRKDQAEANLVFNQSMLLSVLVGAVVILLGYAVTASYIASITADAATAEAGRIYLYWYLPGLALNITMTGLGAALRGTGIVKPTMAVQSATVVMNIVLAPILIAGWGTGHPLGVMGAALATSISIVFGVVMLLGYFIRLEHYVAFNLAEWRPNFAIWKRLLNVGLPAGGEFALFFVIVTVIYACVRQFGADAQAGVAVGLRVGQAIFLPAMAVAFAVSPIAGQNFGAKRADRVRETFKSALWIGIVIMAVLTVLCQLSPTSLIHPFSKDPAVVAVGAQYLHIVSWNFVCNGIIFACSGLFQGLGNTWPALMSSGFRIFTFVLPAIWMAQQPWVKIEDFWYVSVASITLQAVISLLFLRSEMRKRLAFA